MTSSVHDGYGDLFTETRTVLPQAVERVSRALAQCGSLSITLFCHLSVPQVPGLAVASSYSAVRENELRPLFPDCSCGRATQPVRKAGDRLRLCITYLRFWRFLFVLKALERKSL